MVPRIDIEGVIVSNDEKWIYDWYEVDAVCPKDVQTAIDSANGEKLEVHIKSGGGDIFAGADIYSALKMYSGEVEIYIPSLAGSAASEVAMAGKSFMSPNALMMVHNVSVYGASGDYHEMDRTSEMLQKANQSIANTYMAKSGMNKEQALEMMDKTTWLTAQEAKEKGLIDEILFIDGKEDLFLSNDLGGLLSREKIESAKNERSKQQLQTQENEIIKDKLLIELDLL